MSTRDITFNVQKTLDTGIHAVGKKKHYIQDMMTNGLHFRFRNMTNEEIVAEIDACLDSIERELNIPFCLYRDTYNNIIAGGLSQQTHSQLGRNHVFHLGNWKSR